MKTKYLFITNGNCFEDTIFSNPIHLFDHKIENYYPEFYKVNYDLRLLAIKEPTKEEREFFVYNNYPDKYGDSDISVLKVAAENSNSKNIFLNGFRQEHFEYLVPYIKDTAEILYLFKCEKIKDLSFLSEFKNLKCIHIQWNNALECLWNMKKNKDLSVISFVNVSKIRDVSLLLNSNVEYIALDSMDNSGNKKDCLIEDLEVFNKMPNLKHLTLCYKKVNIDY